MTPGNDPLIGAMLGSYKIIEAVGQGGMARIYRGFHAELNRYAAVKVINWGLQEDPEFTERFRREAQAIATLRHPNIVQIFDFGKHSSGYYMVMEFIDGSDLAVQLRRYKSNQQRLPQEQIIQIIKDVAAALDYAHSQNVVHRDVKPSNIMINQAGQSILTDFGLVMLPAHANKSTLGNTFGTPHYVAPEQAISSAAAVDASDIYSLGIILYEMATGQLPFDDESPLSVALKHVSDLPPPPRSFNSDIPKDVEDVILRSLAKDPVDRFATAGDMVLALQAAWGNGLPSGIRESKTVAPLVLPAGVPPAAEVSNITLPNIEAVAPMAGMPIAPLTKSPAEARLSEPLQRHKKIALPLWLILTFVGVIGVLIGVAGLGLFGGANARATLMPSPELILAAVETPSATPTQTPTSTNTPQPPTHTPTTTETPTPTDTPTPAPTDTPTAIPTDTPTLTPTPTNTFIPILPTPTPVGLSGKILFKTDRSGRTEIYRMDATGQNQVPLAREDWAVYSELEPALSYSPDRTGQIVVRGEGQLDLWWANLTTGMELRITSTGQAEYDPAWSPIDNRIAYVSEETGNGDIYMLNLDGSAVVRLTDNLTNFDKHPTWSPDGTKIAFWSDMGFAGNRQIWVVDLATKEMVSLSDNPFNDWDPVWVP